MRLFDRIRAYQRTTTPTLGGFVTEWTTTATDETIYLPLISSGTYSFNVDWGDGSSDTVTVYNESAKNHTYATAGTYTVTITGTIAGWDFSSLSTSRRNLTKILSWGDLQITDDRAFYYCSNLTAITATDTIDLSQTTSLRQMFWGCIKMTSISSFGDTSSVTSFSGTFQYCYKLIKAPDGLDFSSATYVSTMFQYCYDLNDISNLDLGTAPTGLSCLSMFGYCTSLTSVNDINLTKADNVEDMFLNCSAIVTAKNIKLSGPATGVDADSMFRGCSSLEDVTGLEIDNVDISVSMFRDCSSLDTIPNLTATSLVDGAGMFISCTNLPDFTISDTDSLDDASSMFVNCTSLTAPPVTDISALTDGVNMYSGVTFLTTEYDNYLDYLVNTMSPIPINLSINMGSSQYSSGTPTTNRTFLTSAPNNWTITDGGQV